MSRGWPKNIEECSRCGNLSAGACARTRCHGTPGYDAKPIRGNTIPVVPLADAEALRVRNEELARVLEEIRDQDPVENALDPQWAARIAAAAIQGEGGED